MALDRDGDRDTMKWSACGLEMQIGDELERVSLGKVNVAEVWVKVAWRIHTRGVVIPSIHRFKYLFLLYVTRPRCRILHLHYTINGIVLFFFFL